ncbi:McrB family protein [Chryseobacterium chendengshani]|uniref:McrB family protein n=1 Tax=Chryseobacterium sp. LJ756 TaxID=2864113 RepID=UPI001C63E407|nr:AAA family ATPase [Chryseobacterium sp. LJ756]MBW7674755.1 AAA family ATPase [Chryseobacterium sp. LJ756]
MYQELQKQVFEWFKNKYNEDLNFTFSLRQKANKGAELNYFIGTEKSKYFSTTFWYIPVAYPGSSSDLINLVFTITRTKKIEFHFQFNQTKKPHDNQNRYALEFIQSIKLLFKGIFPNEYFAPEANKMELFAGYSKPIYNNFDELKSDLESYLSKIIPIVNQQITEFKEKYPDFTAKRFTFEEQENMFAKMEERFKKYKVIEDLTEELEEEKELVMVDLEIDYNFPLNQILYGPPGTGKTYNTINKAISIANPEFDLHQNRETLKAEYDRLVKNGQIVFTTFHQSMSYEDFIEGIKPQIEEDSDGNKNVIYEIKDGVFKLISQKAQEKRSTEETVNHQFTFDDAWGSLINEANIGLENNNPIQLTIQTPHLGLKIVDVTEKGNLKLKPIYSEEAKEYIVSYSRTKILQEAFPDLSVIKNIDKEFRAVIGGSNSTAYWSVINYINNKINSEKKPTTQEKVLSPFPHILIIDEINRGNVSQIFGELITLIEENKRLGNTEELQLTLPYSKNKFGVPSNLYIIGTMNTADRSVEALDTALRRRFSFVEMMPDISVVEDANFEDYPRAVIMQKINQRIELLLDRNYTLGHSYFIKDDFKASFKNEIIPLLQEYFYNDSSKIGLILGKGFVREKEISKINHQKIFADFETRNEIEVIKSYELIPFEEVDFEIALDLLLA